MIKKDTTCLISKTLDKPLEKKEKFEVIKSYFEKGVYPLDITTWDDIVLMFNNTQLKELYKIHAPSSLRLYSLLNLKNEQTFHYWLKKSKFQDNFPLIGNYISLNKTPNCVMYLSEANASFFKNKSIRRAISLRYQTKSPKLIEKLNDLLFEEKGGVITLNDQYLFVSDFFVELMTGEAGLDVRGAVELLDFWKNKSLSFLKSTNQAKKFAKDLKNIYGAKQLKSVFFDEGVYCFSVLVEINKAIASKILMERIKSRPFREKNNIHKLWKVSCEEQTFLELEDYSFDSVSFFHLENIHNQEFKSYKIIVPDTHYQIIRWGVEMGNCLKDGMVGKRIREYESYLIGVFHEGKIKYCIEIEDKKLIQMEKKYNQAFTKHEEAFITNLLREVGMIDGVSPLIPPRSY